MVLSCAHTLASDADAGWGITSLSHDSGDTLAPRSTIAQLGLTSIQDTVFFHFVIAFAFSFAIVIEILQVILDPDFEQPRWRRADTQ